MCYYISMPMILLVRLCLHFRRAFRSVQQLVQSSKKLTCLPLTLTLQTACMKHCGVCGSITSRRGGSCSVARIFVRAAGGCVEGRTPLNVKRMRAFVKHTPSSRRRRRRLNTKTAVPPVDGTSPPAASSKAEMEMNITEIHVLTPEEEHYMLTSFFKFDTTVAQSKRNFTMVLCNLSR